MSWRPTDRSRTGGIDAVPMPAPGSGSLWLCGKHLVAPDPEAVLAATGAATVICLTERHELVDRYPGYVRWLAAEEGGRARWRPWPDLGAPGVEDAAALVGEVDLLLAAERDVVVHCGAGIGRAGTLAAAVLLGRGMALAAALEHVRGCRPMAGPEAGAQRTLLEALAARG